MLGDVLLFENQDDPENNKIIHTVKNPKTGKDIVIAETYWSDITND